MAAKAKDPPIKLMVSSSVYDKEPFLDQVDAMLSSYGYEVIMSGHGKMFVNSNLSNYENCLAAVEECDAFLGIISGHYGSGEVPGKKASITHLEMRHAVELNKLRWFLVHNDVMVARLLLNQFRFRNGKKRRFKFEKTPVLSDIRVLDLYDEVIQAGVPLQDRTGNWAQPYTDEASALTFLDRQFRDPGRIRKLLR